ncbi:hypothetical protein [Sphingobacterium corticibacterium]|uniref:Uncharacterized protein n=1 Tax=Sphingobacterium corticibacterium TaxID=2484746 RepID=A0A4Q6XQE1_9SPHI|nr:hypothetical protein [Sphingobacterium corticibacterium]RZF58849.1 hypothetical protein EWE74_16130 [Sphingobacterium corticibacterium]
MKILTTNYRYLLSTLLFIAAGCQSSQGDKNVETVVKDVMEYEVPAKDEPLEFQRNKVRGEKDTISFEIQEPSFVKMTLSTPSDSGNIRINQLRMPDGEMDGPFGKMYEARFDQVGTYQVIIAESMMAENPYTGDYRFRIEIE